jgi:hypothetical protein
MKKLLPLLFVLFLFSCKKETIEEEPKDNPPPTDTIPTPEASTLKLSRDFVPGIAFQTITFQYTDITGVERFETNPYMGTVDSVDFSQFVRVTGVAGNNLDSDIFCNWNLKKNEVVIDVQGVSNYLYTN